MPKTVVQLFLGVCLGNYLALKELLCPANLAVELENTDRERLLDNLRVRFIKKEGLAEFATKIVNKEKQMITVLRLL